MDVGFDGYKLLLEKAWLKTMLSQVYTNCKKNSWKYLISIDKMGLFVYEYYLFLHQ
jgi:hypothetical protein